jgi:hypothetical protein
MYKGVLPFPVCERCGEPSVRSLLALPLWITAQYFLMVLALVALCFRRSSKVLLTIAAVGIYEGVRGGWDVGTRLEFLGTFFGLSRSGHVHYGELLVAHVMVMGALLLVSLELRDQESLHAAGPKSPIPIVSRKAQVLDAAIILEDENRGDPTSNDRRLHD